MLTRRCIAGNVGLGFDFRENANATYACVYVGFVQEILFELNQRLASQQ